MAGIALRKRPHIARPTAATRPPRVKGATVPVVEFEDVTKVYDGGSIGLERATMKIGRGEFVFLVGPTGCGKSTCIRLLQKELEASAGEISIAGHELSSMSRSKVPRLRRNIGVVFQDYKLLPNRTIYDNVAYSLQVIGEPRQEIRRKVPDILALVGLSTKLHNYPDELSGGEQQRVSIARAFVNHPPLLLADEAQDRRHLASDRLAVLADHLQRVGHVGVHGAVGKELEVLEDYADVAPQARHLLARHLPQVAPRDEHLALRGLELLQDQSQAGGLAATRRPHQEDELSAVHSERHPIEADRAAVVDLRRVAQLDHRHRGGGFGLRGAATGC